MCQINSNAWKKLKSSIWSLWSQCTQALISRKAIFWGSFQRSIENLGQGGQDRDNQSKAIPAPENQKDDSSQAQSQKSSTRDQQSGSDFGTQNLNQSSGPNVSRSDVQSQRNNGDRDGVSQKVEERIAEAGQGSLFCDNIFTYKSVWYLSSSFCVNGKMQCSRSSTSNFLQSS